jgi:NADH-quinone oxidoreductase subunit E
MTIGLEGTANVRSVVRATVSQFGTNAEALVPILSQINQELGYIPREAMAELGRLLRVPASQVLGVASFYEMLSTEPRGRHVIQFCESAPCHVVGGRQVWQTLQDELELETGETSEDGKWTLQTSSCLGICGVGPVRSPISWHATRKGRRQ